MYAEFFLKGLGKKIRVRILIFLCLMSALVHCRKYKDTEVEGYSHSHSPLDPLVRSPHLSALQHKICGLHHNTNTIITDMYDSVQPQLIARVQSVDHTISPADIEYQISKNYVHLYETEPGESAAWYCYHGEKLA
jgi:hypothetical protein